MGDVPSPSNWVAIMVYLPPTDAWRVCPLSVIVGRSISSASGGCFCRVHAEAGDRGGHGPLAELLNGLVCQSAVMDSSHKDYYLSCRYKLRKSPWLPPFLLTVDLVAAEHAVANCFEHHDSIGLDCQVEMFSNLGSKPESIIMLGV